MPRERSAHAKNPANTAPVLRQRLRGDGLVFAIVFVLSTGRIIDKRDRGLDKPLQIDLRWFDSRLLSRCRPARNL